LVGLGGGTEKQKKKNQIIAEISTGSMKDGTFSTRDS
jgi:hypothetical protein